MHDQLRIWGGYDRVIVFDGVCNFCNASVDFVIKRDPQHKFKFSTLQSEPAQHLLKELGLSRDDFETFLLLERGQASTKSTAVLKIAKHMPGLWPLLYVFILVPKPFRDAVYDFIARNRYRWLGRAETCRVPTPTELDRFV